MGRPSRRRVGAIRLCARGPGILTGLRRPRATEYPVAGRAEPDGLRHIADSLKEFTLVHTTVRLSLRPVANCTRLESLYLQRQTKDFAALRALTRLRYL